jgi:hypothetical protein
MDEHRTAVLLFGIALAVVIALASVTTFDRRDTRIASNAAPSGTTGLAKPHQTARPRARSSDTGASVGAPNAVDDGPDVALSPSRGNRSGAGYCHCYSGQRASK